MSRFAALFIGLGLALTVSGCAASGAAQPTSEPTGIATPTPNQSLVPSPAPVDVIAVDPTVYDDGFGDYVFKVGDGPTACSISTMSNFVLCEQNEAAAVYKPVPVPETCEYSYGYQVRLWGAQPENGDIAEFACSGGPYADAENAEILATGQSISVAGFTCFVEGITARCENATGQWIALGPEVWSLNN